MKIIDVGETSLEFQELGNPANPTIVFTHTILFGPELFDDLVSGLVDDYHLLIVHLPGHGQSSYRSGMTLEGITDDCHELLSKLGLTGVIWVGHSMGGMIGMRMAIKHPQMISSLILIATTAAQEPPGLRYVTGQLWDLFRAGHLEDVVEPSLEYFLSPVTFAERPELAEHFRTEMMNMKNVEGLYTVAQAVINRIDITNEISAISSPTLVLAGKHDVGGASPAESMLIAARIPDARLIILDDASHLLMAEKPDETRRLIHEFLGEIRESSSRS